MRPRTALQLLFSASIASRLAEYRGTDGHTGMGEGPVEDPHPLFGMQIGVRPFHGAH